MPEIWIIQARNPKNNEVVTEEDPTNSRNRNKILASKAAQALADKMTNRTGTRWEPVVSSREE